MGLDLLEIVMDCEDAFGVNIPDEYLMRAHTAGDLHEIIWHLLNLKGSHRFTKEEVWRIVQKLIAEMIAVPLEKVQADSRLIEDLGLG